MKARWSLLVPFLILMTACSGDKDGDGPTGPSGPQIPNLVGTYDGSFTYTASAPGYQTDSITCGARVVISSQNGGAFSGTFSQASSSDCAAESGNVSGTVVEGGSLTLTMTYAGSGSGPTWEDMTGCTILSMDSEYLGSYINGTLDCSRNMTASCPQLGSVSVSINMGFRGT